jgi:AcrR family transcriptional regulator
LFTFSLSQEVLRLYSALAMARATNRQERQDVKVGRTATRMTKAVHQKRRRVGGRSARVRDAVLKSAFELLIEQGHEGFTITEVAARAGVHETSIYRRWGTPNALLVDAWLGYFDDAIPIPDTGALRSDLIALGEGGASVHRSPQGQAILALILVRNEHALKVKHEYWQRRFERLRPIFDRAIARGEFPPDADPIVLLQILIAPRFFRLLVSIEPLDDWPIAEVVDRVLSGYATSPKRTAHRHRRQ